MLGCIFPAFSRPRSFFYFFISTCFASFSALSAVSAVGGRLIEFSVHRLNQWSCFFVTVLCHRKPVNAPGIAQPRVVFTPQNLFLRGHHTQHICSILASHPAALGLHLDAAKFLIPGFHYKEVLVTAIQPNDHKVTLLSTKPPESLVAIQD